MTLVATLAFAAALAQAPDCDAFAAQAKAPVAIETSVIASSRLLASPRDLSEHLIYQGRGVAIRSADPRFAGIQVEHGYAARHRCGYDVHGPGAGHAGSADLASVQVKFAATASREAPPGATQAARDGAVLATPGHETLATWPLGDGFYLGIVRPAGEPQRQTQLVAFDRRTAASPLSLATFSLPFQGVWTLPALHENVWSIGLEGVGEDGALYRVALRMTDAQRAAILAEVRAR